MKKSLLLVLIFCGSLSGYDMMSGDARSIGLGNSIYSGNAAMAWLFPAGLNALSDKEIDLSYERMYLGSDVKTYTGESETFQNIRLSFFMPAGSFGLGAGLFRFTSSSYQFSAFRFTLTRPFGPVAVGVNIKYLFSGFIENEYTSVNPYLNSAQMSSANISFDAGAMLDLIPKKLFLMLSALDVTSPDIGVVNEDRLLPRFLIGAGITFPWFFAVSHLEIWNATLSKFSAGIESRSIAKLLTVRLGFDNSILPNFGFSLKLSDKPLTGIDYAVKPFSAMGDIGGFGSHYLTVYVRF